MKNLTVRPPWIGTNPLPDFLQKQKIPTRTANQDSTNHLHKSSAYPSAALSPSVAFTRFALTIDATIETVNTRPTNPRAIPI